MTDSSMNVIKDEKFIEYDVSSSLEKNCSNNVYFKNSWGVEKVTN